jgi:glycosyltransferase involved in cell wall biosynthesis
VSISICIPTCDRPALVQEALRSALAQTLPAAELLVGDDSSTGETEALIAALQSETSIPIRYERNAVRLGQAANVEKLLRSARSDRLMLLHDDDVLLPDAIENLVAAFDASPDVVAAYGKQLIIDEAGTIDEAGSADLNRDFYRSSEREGVQPNSLKAAVLQQFTNDGFLVDRRLAARVGYVHPWVKDGVDFAFAMALARLGGSFVFVDRFTMKVRLTAASITHRKANTAAYDALRLALEAPELDRSDPEIASWLARLVPRAIDSAAESGHRATALRWYFGALHRSRILSPSGMSRLLLIAAPYLQGLTRQRRRSPA